MRLRQSTPFFLTLLLLTVIAFVHFSFREHERVVYVGGVEGGGLRTEKASEAVEKALPVVPLYPRVVHAELNITASLAGFPSLSEVRNPGTIPPAKPLPVLVALWKRQTPQVATHVALTRSARGACPNVGERRTVIEPEARGAMSNRLTSGEVEGVFIYRDVEREECVDPFLSKRYPEVRMALRCNFFTRQYKY